MSGAWSGVILRYLGKPTPPSPLSYEAAKLDSWYRHASWPEANIQELRQSAFDLILFYPHEFRYWFPCFFAAMLEANESVRPPPDVVDTSLTILASITAISWGSNESLKRRLTSFSGSERLWFAQILEEAFGCNVLYVEEMKLAVETLRREEVG